MTPAPNAHVDTPQSPVMPISVLVVEDEALLARAVTRRLERLGYQCIACGTLAEARRTLTDQNRNIDVILLDVRLPDGNGLDLLADLSKSEAAVKPATIIFTAFGEINDAVTAMKLGAADFLKKPIDLDELNLVIQRVIDSAELSRRLETSREREARSVEGPVLIGESPAMTAARAKIEQVSGILPENDEPRPTVLIMGETGTGKDVTARMIHRLGPKADRPFVHVDCAALPRELLEAELFGHVRGACTSATGSRIGLIEAAEDGTLFLDEIAELPFELQAKLLALVERRRIRRIGSPSEINVGADFIAATNRPLPELVASGQFRSDLFYRLNVLSIQLPSLRDCEGDSVILARHFAAQVARRFGRPAPTYTRDAERAIRTYHWPGNVRELKHLVERAVLLSEGEAISAIHLGLEGPAAPHAAPADGEDDALSGLTIEQAERKMILAALDRSRGNVSEAARQLGLTRMALRYRIEKYRFGNGVRGNGG